MAPPSAALTVVGVTETPAESLSVMVPVAVSVSVTNALDAVKLTVKVSAPSTELSSSVATVTGCVSPAVPAKVTVWVRLS